MRLVEGARDLRSFADIGCDRQRLSAVTGNLPGQGLEAVLAPRHDDDPRAMAGKREREAPAEAGGGARDERNLSREIEGGGGW